MAKKLKLLKPDRKTVYLENGKGQRVDYLQISDDLGLDTLKKDVKAGALHFKECMEFVEKKPSRVVLIECENEEEGLMAASYLAGAYNEKEIDYEKEWILGGCSEDDLEACGSEEKVDRTLEDYKDMEEDFSFNEDLEGADYYNPDEEEVWIESHKRLPVVKLAELINYSNRDRDSIFYQGPMGMGGLAPEQLQKVIKACVNQAIFQGRGDIKKNKIAAYQEFLSAILHAFSDWAYKEQLFTNDNVAEIYTEYTFSYATKDLEITEKTGETWINGTADLMILGKDGTLQILDYKSDRDDYLTEDQFVCALKETYGGQLALYKKSMARLFGIDESKISLGIFSFTEKETPGQVNIRHTRMNCS